MKRTLLLAAMLLFVLQINTQAAVLPVPQPPLSDNFIQSGKTSTTPAVRFGEVFRMPVTIASTGVVTTIYARLAYENETYDGISLIGDVVVRFYSDAGGTIPYSAPTILVNFRIIGYDGYNGYDYYSSAYASGTDYVVAGSQEHDYNDGFIQRYKDYHLAPGVDYAGGY